MSPPGIWIRATAKPSWSCFKISIAKAQPSAWSLTTHGSLSTRNGKSTCSTAKSWPKKSCRNSCRASRPESGNRHRCSGFLVMLGISEVRDGGTAPGSSLRPAATAQEPGIHHRGPDHAGARDRSEYRDFQRCECRPAQAARNPGTLSRHLCAGAMARHLRRALGGKLRRGAAAKHFVREPVRIEQREFQPSNPGNSRTGGGRNRHRELLCHVRRSADSRTRFHCRRG